MIINDDYEQQYLRHSHPAAHYRRIPRRRSCRKLIQPPFWLGSDVKDLVADRGLVWNSHDDENNKVSMKM